MSEIRLSKSCVGEEEKAALARVIDNGYLGMGQEVQLFENELKAYLDTEAEVICVNSGTAALHLALCCLDLGPGDEVLVPTITYVASFQAISATGAKPIACDVSNDRVFINLIDAQQRITSKTKAIMPVHFASDSQSMTNVYEFAKYNNLRVIEDAAHGFGSRRNGRQIGYEGDVICFSFDGIKNITSGEGGAVVTSDKLLARRIKDARLLGVESDTEKRYKGQRSWSFSVNHQGFRYHMSNLMAAIGREQLKKINIFASHRRACAARYIKKLKTVKSLKFLDIDYDNIVPHIFVVQIQDGYRDSLMNALQTNEIQCGIHYMSNHLLDYFKVDYALPTAEEVEKKLLTLPLHADLTFDEQDKVIRVILNFFNV
jgi:dTDP-4-amino-4,6-dideoxygalactose transaminase